MMHFDIIVSLACSANGTMKDCAEPNLCTAVMRSWQYRTEDTGTQQVHEAAYLGKMMMGL